MNLLFFCPDFLAVPPANVYVPAAGMAELYCEYGDPQGIPRRVDWYRQEQIILPTLLGCGCATQRHGLGVTLYFLGYLDFNSNEYGCWATTSGGAVYKCIVNVALAGIRMTIMSIARGRSSVCVWREGADLHNFKLMNPSPLGTHYPCLENS